MQLTSRRYIGSKTKLLDWIFSEIKNNVKGESFLDIFAGTGSVAERALSNYDNVIVNDILSSNKVIYEAFWGSEKINIDTIYEYRVMFNNLSIIDSQNYFSTNYGDKYFGISDAKKIGYIRDLIDQDYKKGIINEREFNILLASLIYSMDKIANTVGHYEAYRKIDIVDDRFKFELIDLPNCSEKKIDIFQEDANELAKEIYSDIVFLDPPYNSRQYSRFYHVIENLVEWEKPNLYGVALKPEPKNMSEYCRKGAPIVFDDLISNLNCKYIVVTYNNTYNSKSSSSKNKIKLEEILESLNKRGKTKVFESDYRFFNAGKTDFPNHKEYLFITEVNCEKWTTNYPKGLVAFYHKFCKSGQWLNKFLNEQGIQYKQSGTWLLYQKYAQMGYTKSETYIDEETGFTKLNTKWTQKGRLFIYDLMKSNGYLPLIEREENYYD